MKNLVYIFFVCFFITACQNSPSNPTTTTSTKPAATKQKMDVWGLVVPQFKDPKVNQMVADYVAETNKLKTGEPFNNKKQSDLNNAILQAVENDAEAKRKFGDYRKTLQSELDAFFKIKR